MTSQAEKWRAHREEMALVMETGCTPKEARKQLDAMRARERIRAAQDLLASRRNPPRVAVAAEKPERVEPWMMRD